MFSVLIISYLILSINSVSIDIIENDLNHTIEKILLINENLYVGTRNVLHRLSSLSLNRTIPSLQLIPLSDNFECIQCDRNNHIKILLRVHKENILLCGTIFQGTCQILDQDFNLIINSSLPIVANDPINSTNALIIQERNLIYFGVTYTNEGTQRWQIPNISGRSLNVSRFMKILSTNDDERISRDDLSLRFMSRQQTRFIVQYIYSFYTENYIYFITNQPNDIEQKQILTKIIRFCRDSSNSIIRTYIEIPLLCSNSEWFIKTAEIFFNDKNQPILIGHFARKDGAGGTNICLWNIQNDIDRAFEDNYRTCYSMGIGKRGLAFIKPNEPCRKDESWSIPINSDNLCPWIINDRFPYPVGGTTPAIGHLFYENILESSSAFQIYSFGSSNLIFQGLTNGTFKLGLYDFGVKINWFYSYQLSTATPILSNVIFDNKTETFFLASESKIYRISLSGDCTSRLSCDECLSSSNSPLCGWCTMNQRCTLANNCPLNFWQQENNHCTHIVRVQPLKASIDNIQWINLTLTKLPQLEHNEIYQCIFMDKIISASTQAIKLDHNRLSCPTPSKNIHVHKGSHLKLRLSIIKWPSNVSIATVSDFTFYNCSSYSSCVSCRSEFGCQWCSQRCSSMCTEFSSQCSSVDLLNSSNIFLESKQSIEIPLKFDHIQYDNRIECRLNETIYGLVNSDSICSISKMSHINDENEQIVFLTVHQNNILIGNPIKMFIYRCDLYDTCDKCNLRSKCSWCQGRCLTNSINKCLINEQCTSLRIVDFSPKSIPLNGRTIINILLNEHINEEIIEILLADIPCLLINSSNIIQCQAIVSNYSRKGHISVQFSNSIYILSKEYIEYCQSSINSITPNIVYEVGGQILYLSGKNLFIGNEQTIFIGDYRCLQLKQISLNNLSCQLPPMASRIYNITLKIDKQLLNVEQNLKVTPNPIVEDIDPTISFASGGRLIFVRGMHFGSAQTITVKFSHRKWIAKLKINTNDILSAKDGMISSFYFRTPSLPTSSNDFPSPPLDVNFSLYFDNSIISLINIIQFHYIPDVLLNISSTLPSLPYTGEELKLHVENLTEAASMSDIQLFIGCSECKLRTFTSKSITCQPPKKLIINTAIILNNPQQHDDCTLFNSSIGPIRFRIGYREYLIGYLSYSRLLSVKYSKITIVSLIFASSLLTISVLSFGLYLFYKYFGKSKSKTNVLSNKNNANANDKQFWSTDTSASPAPYYQVYEQISCLSAHDNTLTRAPLLQCPYYQEKRCTPPIMEQLQMSSSFLTTISIEDDQLKQLLFKKSQKFSSTKYRPSMELFYDLLNMKPFSEAFIDQLIENHSTDLIESYVYLFRYSPQNFKLFPLTRESVFQKFFSNLFLQSKNQLINKFHLFDDFLRILIDSIDSSPCDELLNRSSRSVSSTTLLLNNIAYRSYELKINYENLLHFHVNVLDCDTIDKLKQKIIHYLNSNENTNRLIEYDEVDLSMPSINSYSYSDQIPMLKNFLPNSTIYCQKKYIIKKESKTFVYHLCKENQLILEKHFMEEKLKENKHRLQQIFIYFCQQIMNGLDLFFIFENEENQQVLFQRYIQLVSDLIRRLNRLMLCRSACPIIESCLNSIADGLEFIFDTKTEFSSEIKLLFMDDKKYFSTFNKNNFHICSSNQFNPQFSPIDTRSLTLKDDSAIESLLKLYQFYELYSEPINQHIGENHVSILLPVHHLLVQIRQLLPSDNITLI
ncbi:unnamed protein product [Rotaria magnacalcarata]|uniref:Sema domain-containing protein n=2 Tax=Rotaria magnacalcarata TaxID=392030 RepID=A0A814ZPM6_9BILA|nr:unnamed protein product [Rotaria magnacalcarata]